MIEGNSDSRCSVPGGAASDATDLAWIDVKLAARRARCSVPTILRAARSGRLKSVQLNSRRYRFRPTWIDLWLQEETPDYLANLQRLRKVGR
jgi:hypothetical protein